MDSSLVDPNWTPAQRAYYLTGTPLPAATDETLYGQQLAKPGATLPGVFQWGLPGDLPLTADFDGDGRADIAVYRPSTGEWFIRYSASAYDSTTPGHFQWGTSEDGPLTADFDGDGQAEISTYRPSTSEWLIRSYSKARTDTTTRFQWGVTGDIPLAR
jgi:hypothetical protein